MDTDKLLKALEDDSNETLMNFSTIKIRQMNYQIVHELHLYQNDEQKLLDKLNGYKYVDEIADLRYGTYLRWINITDPNKIFLTKGALFCNVKITDDGIFLVCKNYGPFSRHFQLNMDSNLIFQKLTDQENILLSALDHLSKN
jgi:hypothetical protein